ncbi:MAG: hypothetical protein E6G97_15925 [Alphaproteobacteria bacterium]|nr:MAG: hypothetical protein E6G97_15925 [Alphaproteobacteria bacterium]
MSKKAVLGISAFAHDTASCLVDMGDGKVLYALAEERLSNLKHDSRFPIGSVRQALDLAEQHGYAVTDVALNTDPAHFIAGRLAPLIRNLVPDREKADSLIDDLLSLHRFPDYYLLSGYSFATAHIERLVARLGLSSPAAEKLRGRLSWHYNWAVKYQFIRHYCRELFPHATIHSVPHHLAHAASAYFASGFSEATVLVVDGQGEHESVSAYCADQAGLGLVSSSTYPSSLGLFYLTCTEHLGFSLGDEYKVMGMAAYGRPTLFEAISSFMRVTEKGELHFCENEYFILDELRANTGHAIVRATPALCALVPQREATAQIGQNHFDFAASIQLLTENIGVELARRAIARTGKSPLVMTGGVALNGLMNERIRRESGCGDIFIYPAAGDDGTAVGAAQSVAMQSGVRPMGGIRTCFYGNASSDAGIARELEQRGIRSTQPDDIHATIAEALTRGKIVARFVGNSEFGPRALGNRSILADPRDVRMRDILNVRIKHRESFRPFAPACLRERIDEYFELDADAPFMLLICQATDLARRQIPAAVHQDGTARVQSVDGESNPEFYRVIHEFGRRTGVPVLINTSFNVNGETIVDTAADAIESFLFMDIDYLAINGYWVAKEENPGHSLSSIPHDDYLALRRTRYEHRYPEALSSLDLARFHASFFSAQSASRSRSAVRPRSPYRMGEKIAFRGSGQSDDYKLAGWSDPEPWGTWTDGPAASLEIPIGFDPQGAVRMTCVASGFVPPSRAQQVAHVVVNGEVVGHWTFKPGEASQPRHAIIPADVVARQTPLRIDFLIGDPTAPLDLGLSEDSRRLGIGIVDLTLTPLTQRTARD